MTRAHQGRKVVPLLMNDGTGFCPSCLDLEYFTIQNEAKVSADTLRCLVGQQARVVAVEFFCGRRWQLVTAA